MREERIKKALDGFHHPYNCAQTIGAVYGETDGREGLLEELRALGGGRGVKCGALLGALRTGGEKGLDGGEIERRFQAKVGAVDCRALKAAGVACNRCVMSAAEVLEEMLAEQSIKSE